MTAFGPAPGSVRSRRSSRRSAVLDSAATTTARASSPSPVVVPIADASSSVRQPWCGDQFLSLGLDQGAARGERERELLARDGRERGAIARDPLRAAGRTDIGILGELAAELGSLRVLAVAHELGRDRVARRERFQRSAGQILDEVGTAIEQLEPARVAGARRGVDRDIDHAQPAGAGGHRRRCGIALVRIVVHSLDRRPAHPQRACRIVAMVEHQGRGRRDVLGERGPRHLRPANLDDALPVSCRRIRERGELGRVRPPPGGRSGERLVCERRGEVGAAMPPQPGLGELERERRARCGELAGRRGQRGLVAIAERRRQPQARREWMALGELEVAHRLVGLVQPIPRGEGRAYVEIGEPLLVALEQRFGLGRDEHEHALHELSGIRRLEVLGVLVEHLWLVGRICAGPLDRHDVGLRRTRYRDARDRRRPRRRSSVSRRIRHSTPIVPIIGWRRQQREIRATLHEVVQRREPDCSQLPFDAVFPRPLRS